MGYENEIYTVVRSAIAAVGLSAPFLLHSAETALSENTWEPIVATGYYCRQVPGYPIWDGGGFCGGTASGFEKISGKTAACGSKWPIGTPLKLDKHPEFVVCNDRGNLPWNGVDVYFETNEELYYSGVQNNKIAQIADPFQIEPKNDTFTYLLPNIEAYLYPN